MSFSTVSRYCLLLGLLPFLLTSTAEAQASLLGDPAAEDSAERSIEHLRRVMDQFHDRFPVYDDVSSAGNHFHTWAKIPNVNAAVSISGSSTESPHGGATAIRAQFSNTTGLNFGGFYFLNGVLPPGAQAPEPNFGEIASAGVDLSGATTLSFWARGLSGGERVEFFMGGVGRNPSTGHPFAPFPDSTPVVKRAVTLTRNWQRYALDLAGRDLSYVLGGFGWVASAVDNPTGAVFFIDDIQYELSAEARETRLDEARFLRSFATEPVQSLPLPVGDFDLVSRNSATTYDNALALLAFLAHGSPDSLRRARLIGDAFVYAKEHDRFYGGDRLRDVYAAGDLVLPPGWTPNGRTGTVPIPGYLDEQTQRFVEIEQSGLSTGNNAWAVIALLGLFQSTGETRYRDTAVELAHFIRGFRQTTGVYQGFVGGLDAPETNAPRRRIWGSTEHNLDVYAAFTTLYELTGQPEWQEHAAHARRFVEAMWEDQRGCILAGTIDPDTRNQLEGQLPSDTQSWTVVAVPPVAALHPEILDCVEANHRIQDQGFSGVDFNEDRDGVWFEGTAHLAVAYASAGLEPEAEALRAELRRAQEIAPFGDERGIAAASTDGLTTGLGLLFFRRLHVGATAWNVFAQSRFDPFTAAAIPHAPCRHGPDVLCLLDDRFSIAVAWRLSNGTTGSGQTIPFTDRAGLFYFFNEANLEMLIKVLNACTLNNHFWVFYAATTNIEFTVTVTDTQTGRWKSYSNPLNSPAPPIQDTQAFRCP